MITLKNILIILIFGIVGIVIDWLMFSSWRIAVIGGATYGITLLGIVAVIAIIQKKEES